jgi:hypothetical protein
MRPTTPPWTTYVKKRHVGYWMCNVERKASFVNYNALCLFRTEASVKESQKVRGSHYIQDVS